MIFTEARFFLFFAFVFTLHWLLRGSGQRKLMLLAASYLFYGVWDYRFLSLIIISTVTDYVAGQKILNAKSDRARKGWLLVSLVVNLGMLGIFKYLNFFVDSFIDFANLMGLPASSVTLNIVLPIGISFYTFQTLSYTIDIYRGRVKPADSFSDFAFFVAFFPQLVAGPIVRARDFLPQLSKRLKLSEVDFRWALSLFLVGFIKKVVVADNLAIFVDAFYANPAAHSATEAWLALIAYMAQIYCDFSGYTDMAIGAAGLLGYRLRPNFNTPFLSPDITQFWQRWHMSMASWFRDYVFLTLERGNRSRKAGNMLGTLLTYRNLILTFSLSGLWHGAAWTFVLWGTAQGIALVGHRFWKDNLAEKLPRIPEIAAIVITQIFNGWVLILFRSDSLATADAVNGRLLDFGNPAFGTLDITDQYLMFAALMGMWALHYIRQSGTFVPLWRNCHALVFAGGYGLMFALAIAFRAEQYQPFIYFQF